MLFRSCLCGLALLLGLAVLTAPQSSLAEPPSKADIRDAKKLARKAKYKARKSWPEARALYEEAEKKHPYWEYAAALAAGHRDDGQLILAWEAVGRARKLGVPTKNQAAVDELAADIEKRLLETHAYLQLEVDPPDARVRINGEQWRPPYKRWVKGSLSKLSFEHGDYLPMEVKWHHPAGHKAAKNVKMVPKSAYGRIEVEGYPAGAVVTLDGRDLGVLPKARTGLLAPGSYKVQVTKAEFDT